MSDVQQVAEPTVTQQVQPKPATKPKLDKLPPYHVVLVNDDDHTYDYVVEMLQKIFNHSEAQAFLMALQVDRTGKAIVCTTHKERAELKCEQIRSYGLDLRVASCTTSMLAVIQEG
jgi:ATP-dependent Clp protease adaptor protein ClpS